MKQITLSTLKDATAQEVFDQVKDHLLRQNKKSKVPETYFCMYRGPDNLKCAAGCLIADEEYKKEFENETWKELVYNGRAPSEHEGLIFRLQKIHDRNSVQYWREELEGLAEDFGLEFVEE